jgi:subtilase family serine protease
MLDLIAAAAFAPLVAVTSSACADPAIVSATSTGGAAAATTYDVAIVVRNLGRGAQPSSLLQSVQVYQNGVKVDQKGVLPLKPGASQTVHYRLMRANDAEAGSTHLRLTLVMHDAHGARVTDCSTANDTFRLDV